MTRLLAFASIPLTAGCSPTATPANETAAADLTSANDVAPVANVAMPPSADAPGMSSAAPEATPIPARFRGSWANSKSACADEKHHSRLEISERVVRYPSFVLLGDSVTLPAANQFAVKGKAEETGRPAEAHFSIDVGGGVLTDEAGGGTVRVRCA